MTDDLIVWFRRLLADDERVAREACHGRNGQWRQTDPDRDRETVRIEDERGEVVVYDEGAPTEWQAEHIARHDPAAVLADIAAKRAIIDEYEQAKAFYSQPDLDPYRWPDKQTIGLGQAIQHLASAYADRPGYRDEWRP